MFYVKWFFMNRGFFDFFRKVYGRFKGFLFVGYRKEVNKVDKWCK